MRTDTIAAIASGLSSAGISIIRISGSDAFMIIDQLYISRSGISKAGNDDSYSGIDECTSHKVLSKEKSHTIHYGYIAENGHVIDEVMVVIMRAPSTYTREDTVEIDCHGGIVVTRRILEAVIRHGARIAEPGEFTKRAFLNGRIDLSQAEAVSDIINAKNELALKNSINQLRGKELELIKDLRQSILRDVAFIEAALDDPEHISLDGFSEDLRNHLETEKKKIEKLIRESKNGRFIKEGIKTVILGKPNVGKSSLLNRLTGEERAIVTDIAGTTRDTLEETIELGNITLNIIDTAGIRKTKDIIEKIGVEKAIQLSKDADLIVFIADASTELDDNDKDILKMIEDKKAIILLNKTDLELKTKPEDLKIIIDKPIINISLKTNSDLTEFEDLIKEMFFHGDISFNDEVYITNERHREALEKSIESLKMVNQSIEDNMPEDFFSIDLMSAYEELGKIIGENVEEDLINMIFKEFCMGK